MASLVRIHRSTHMAVSRRGILPAFALQRDPTLRLMEDPTALGSHEGLSEPVRNRDSCGWPSTSTRT
jgi:hypothetical protein